MVQCSTESLLSGEPWRPTVSKRIQLPGEVQLLLPMLRNLFKRHSGNLRIAASGGTLSMFYAGAAACKKRRPYQHRHFQVDG